MTLLDVAFTYEKAPGEREMRALREVREVYGIWCVSFDEGNRVIRVEYDASRLREDDVAALLRSAGINLLETLSLATTPANAS
ncbi:MAG: hypothetical protein ABSD20_12665 [Terriglobales bacterium]